ncbi:hypothetical protein BS17DRAFT_795438 [Gyrodon lividus]|nr:hypothetical protein BS17DRAFT_795438 [Gyrodon lividus]
MHLLSLDLPDLLIPLWHSTFECGAGDDKAMCDWAFAAAIVDIPGMFGCPPHNPAEKINSEYKAWKFHLYLWGLGPGLLHGVLPDPYWRNFCKLAQAVQLITQHSISCQELETANSLFLEQHSNCYANLTQCAIHHAQVNALKAIIPTIDRDARKPTKPHGSFGLGNGYLLLPHHKCKLTFLSHGGCFKVRQWARLQLPNGQKCRSLWCTREHPNSLLFRFQSSLYFVNSDPHPQTLLESSGTLYSCKYLRGTSLAVIPVQNIDQIVSMNPHKIDELLLYV